MRILHFCNYAERIGGAEVYAHALMAAQRDGGHTVALFGASPERELDQPELRVVRRPLYDADHLVGDERTLKALDDFLARFRPDVVHAHNLFSVALQVVAHLGKTGLPLVHTVHDYQLLCPNSWCVRGTGEICPGGAGAQCFQHGCQENYPFDAWQVLLAAERQRIVERITRVALAPSRALCERLQAHGWRDVRHLPYFVDFEPAPPTRSGSGSELLFAGRLQREKGVNVLLLAMPRIVAQRPSAQLTVVGAGPESGSLKRMVRDLALERAVRFVEGVRREQLAEHYARASLCVLPSVWAENSPLVAYECLVSGLPMVGSRIGGIPDLIEPDCGFTFRPRDHADLAQGVLRYLDLSPAQRQLVSDAARARARSLGKAEHLRSIEQVYGEVGNSPSETLTTETKERLVMLAELERQRGQSAPVPARERARRLARSLGLPKIFGR